MDDCSEKDKDVKFYKRLIDNDFNSQSQLCLGRQKLICLSTTLEFALNTFILNISVTMYNSVDRIN